MPDAVYPWSQKPIIQNGRFADSWVKFFHYLARGGAGSSGLSEVEVSGATGSNYVLDTFDLTGKTLVVYFITASDGTNQRSGMLMAHWLESSSPAAGPEIGPPFNGTPAISFQITTASGDGVLYAQVTSGTYAVKAIRILI